MKTFLKIHLFLLCWLVDPALYAQNAIAISSKDGPGLYIALNWQPVSHAVKYNIFRKENITTAYPVTPINHLPVAPAGNCFTIKSLLITAPDSASWKIVAGSLADTALFDPCQMNTIHADSPKYTLLRQLTARNMPIARAAGLAYEDWSVLSGNTYFYRIVGLDAAGNQLGEAGTDLKVVAGVFTPLPAPTGIVAEAGDAMIQIRWNTVPGAGGYVVERSVNPLGSGFRTNPDNYYRRINPAVNTGRVSHHLNGDTLIPTMEGYTDYQHFDPVSGKPVAHEVVAQEPVTIVNHISGPRNGVRYYYRIRTVDFFGRHGPVSPLTAIGATARDTTPPAVPIDIFATPDNVAGYVNIRWTQVVRDINGHWEQPDSAMHYKVYRFPSSNMSDTTRAVLIGEVHPVRGLQSRDTTDYGPGLRAPYGDKTWWYRVRTIDLSGNISPWSTATSAVVKDTTKPDIVHGVTAQGEEEHITVKWQLNAEPDIASYMVYRSLCHLGEWKECNPNDSCLQWRLYNLPGGGLTFNNTLAGRPPDEPNRPTTLLPCPCSGPFVFLGEVTQDSAKKALAANHVIIDDHTIPKGSPLCYAYWVKAKDSSGNQSGSFPFPSPIEKGQIICQRLRDHTPPEPALIAGLYAQANQIRVEWMGPPTQDTRAYHVYRATGKLPANEPGDTAYKWVGGMTIELPPAPPQVLTAPYTSPGIPVCDRISVQATPWMSAGFFEDKTVEPKKTYWYKVVGIDYDGNETPLSKAAAISTFTFAKTEIPAPVLETLTLQTDTCGILLQWSPAFDPALHTGFMVYRSTSSGGPFIPVAAGVMKTNTYTDKQVVHNVQYWYRIGLLMKNGQLSALTSPQLISP
ncbi:hypothetical protein [Chitinophaga sp. RAB17]|uniref:hypothetical protein n=1 Tax=Chitinophaga sp. RAB17 TaxID=3233049 RepID=UPI003F8ED335